MRTFPFKNISNKILQIIYFDNTLKFSESESNGISDIINRQLNMYKNVARIVKLIKWGKQENIQEHIQMITLTWK